MERRPSALDHGAGGNRVSGFEFRRGALPAKPGSILRRPEAHRKKIASDQHVGLFATVIGLLSWVSLAAQIVLIAAEINAVRSTGLWPRSLRGAMTDGGPRCGRELRAVRTPRPA